jgi:hypothetical protein
MESYFYYPRKLEHITRLDPTLLKENSYAIHNEAAKRGDLKCLRWLKRNSYSCDANPPAIAARSGHLKVLKWLHKNAYPIIWSRVASEAAEHGHLSILKWIKELGIQFTPDVYTSAEKGGHRAIITWLETYNTIVL